MSLLVGPEELTGLAKVMEVKFTVSGPPIGGAKSGIRFDPSSPQKQQVLERFTEAIAPLLKNYYGTGGDLNIDQVKELEPCLARLGIWHPQEGIVRAHIATNQRNKQLIVHGLHTYIKAPVKEEPYAIVAGEPLPLNDCITGWGVAQAVKAYYEFFRGEDLTGKRILVQGFGVVGGSAAYYLAKMGAKITGIADVHGGVLTDQGFTAEDILQMLASRKGRQLSHSSLIPNPEFERRFWTTEADVFVPAAASRIVKKHQVQALVERGLECIACGANLPFEERELLWGTVSRWADEHLGLLPDFIASCGMAAAFSYFMLNDPSTYSVGACFEWVDEKVRHALQEIKEISDHTKRITERALFIALKKLGISN